MPDIFYFYCFSLPLFLNCFLLFEGNHLHLFADSHCCVCFTNQDEVRLLFFSKSLSSRNCQLKGLFEFLKYLYFCNLAGFSGYFSSIYIIGWAKTACKAIILMGRSSNLKARPQYDKTCLQQQSFYSLLVPLLRLLVKRSTDTALVYKEIFNSNWIP